MALTLVADDALGLCGEYLDAHDIARLSMTCRAMRAAQSRLVGGRLRRARRHPNMGRSLQASRTHPTPLPRAGYWRSLYRSSLPFREFHSTGAMNAVDLARTEAWIHAPSGACVCCLRRAPLKLGARCVDCVANESATFAQGSADAPRSPVKCATSHGPSVFTCPLCEVSSCLQCLVWDRGCSMCRLAVDAELGGCDADDTLGALRNES